jgi:hypothetical protein
MVEEHAFLQYFPQQIDLVAVAKKNTPEGQSARAQIRQLVNAVFSNSNSLRDSYASSSGNTAEMLASIQTDPTPMQIQRLRNMGLENMIPGPEVQGFARDEAMRQIREVFFNELASNTSSNSSIHSQRSFDDPLHLSGGEILLLRRQGPEGVEHIRRATMSADQEIVMDQVAEARAFLSAALSRGRSRSGSRSSQGSLAEYQAINAAAFPEGSQSSVSESSGTGPLETLASLGSFSSSSRGSSSRGSRGSRGSRSSTRS